MLVSVTQGPEISPFFLVSVFIIILYTTKCFESITGLNISSLFRVNELFVFQIHLNGSELWMNNVLCVCVCLQAARWSKLWKLRLYIQPELWASTIEKEPSTSDRTRI